MYIYLYTYICLHTYMYTIYIYQQSLRTQAGVSVVVTHSASKVIAPSVCQKFSKVRSTVMFGSNYHSELTFQNLCNDRI